MKGYLLLEGGAEFEGEMSVPDIRALELVGDLNVPMHLLPTAAAKDHNDQRAGANGIRWFTSLGATNVTSLALVDRISANRKDIVEILRNSRFIFLLGGFPGYLYKSLRKSLSWTAILAAYSSGAIIGGSSAGAMILCEHFYDPEVDAISAGLSLISKACIIPHHDTFGNNWVSRLIDWLPEDTLVGIDEQTGMIDDGFEGSWTVYGKGTVTLYRGGTTEIYRSNESFTL
jgi:cyanophycinase